MSNITINDLVKELDEAYKKAKIYDRPSAMVAATMGKARLLGLDRVYVNHDDMTLPVQIIVSVKDAQKS